MKADDNRANKRPQRVPLHKQQHFVAEPREGYERRYVNDLPGRIDSFKQAGWTIVSGDLDKTHDGLAQVEGQIGSQIKRVVNRDPNAPCRHAVLMEIPTEWYLEDKAEQQKLLEQKEESFDPKGMHKSSNMYGSMKRDLGTKG